MNNKIIFGILIAAIFVFSAANAQVFTSIDIPLLQADNKPFGDKLYIEKGAVLEGDVVIGPTGVAESGWSSFIIELPAIGSTGCNFNLLSKDEPGLNPMTCTSGGTGCQCDIITWLKTPNTPVPAYQRSGVPMVDGSNKIIAGAQNTISFKTSVAVDTGVSDSNTAVVKASAPLSSSNIIIKNGIPTGYVTVINTGTKSAGIDYDIVDPNGAPTAGRQGYGLFYGDHIYFYDDAQTGDQNLIRINIEHTVGSYTLYISNLLANTEGNLIIDNIGNAASPGIDYTRPGYTPNTVPAGFTKDILVYKPNSSYRVADFCPGTDIYSGTGVNDIAAVWATSKATCQGGTTRSTIDTRINTDLGWTGQWFVYLNAAGSGGSTVGTDTQLDINDSAEGSTVATGAPVTFYAYYYNLTSGAPIDNTKSTCNLTHDASGSNTTYTMIYNSGRWENTTATGYSTYGGKAWSVTCNTTAAGFFNATANDDISVTNGAAVPEFSDIAWVLAAVLGAGSFVLIRKVRKGF